MISVLEDFGFADDNALLISKYEHIQYNTARVAKVRAGSDKTEDVTEFVHLIAKVSKDGWRNRGH